MGLGQISADSHDRAGHRAAAQGKKILFLFPLDNIVVVAVVADQLLPFVGDMRDEGCNPIRDRKDGEVFLRTGSS